MLVVVVVAMVCICIEVHMYAGIYQCYMIVANVYCLVEARHRMALVANFIR